MIAFIAYSLFSSMLFGYYGMKIKGNTLWRRCLKLTNLGMMILGVLLAMIAAGLIRPV